MPHARSPQCRFGTARAAADERGFALVSVIVIATLIAVIAVGLTALVRGVAHDSASLVSDAEARAGTEAGLNRIILAYARAGDPLRAALIPDGRRVAWEFAGKTLTLRVQAESGKLDLNAGDRTHIGALIGRLVEQPVQAEFLAQLDHARAARARITAVAALLPPIHRMTAIRDLIEAHFTIMTDQRGVDPTTAPALVLDTMPRLSDETRRAILAARHARRPLPLDDIDETARARLVSERPIYTLRAETAAGFGRAGAMQALVSFSEQGRLAVHAWGAAGISR